MLIRWALQRDTSTLPKSTSRARIAANLAALGWQLGPADMAALSRLPYQACARRFPLLPSAGPPPFSGVGSPLSCADCSIGPLTAVWRTAAGAHGGRRLPAGSGRAVQVRGLRTATGSQNLEPDLKS